MPNIKQLMGQHLSYFTKKVVKEIENSAYPVDVSCRSDRVVLYTDGAVYTFPLYIKSADDGVYKSEGRECRSSIACMFCCHEQSSES
jgi:hypothetical protein